MAKKSIEGQELLVRKQSAVLTGIALSRAQGQYTLSAMPGSANRRDRRDARIEAG